MAIMAKTLPLRVNRAARACGLLRETGSRNGNWALGLSLVTIQLYPTRPAHSGLRAGGKPCNSSVEPYCPQPPTPEPLTIKNFDVTPPYTPNNLMMKCQTAGTSTSGKIAAYEPSILNPQLSPKPYTPNTRDSGFGKAAPLSAGDHGATSDPVYKGSYAMNYRRRHTRFVAYNGIQTDSPPPPNLLGI